MGSVDQIYRDLQKHLDEQTVGFPATESGSDIQLLKQLFPIDQAKAAVTLTYKFEPLPQIQERAKNIGCTVDDLEGVLDETARQGMIGYRKRDGVKQFCNIPYIVGMGEAAARNPTAEAVEAATKYSEDGLFWGAFLTSKVPQMRAIPIEQSITPEHQVSTFDEVKAIIESTEDPIAIFPCVCREGAKRRDEPCLVTTRTDTCMGFRDGAKAIIENGTGREISKEEALDILRKNGEEGMILQPSNAQGPDFICSCCGCCCGILQLHKAVPNPVSYWATNYYAKGDPEMCSGCSICVDICAADAVTLDENEISSFNLERCLGCGNCVVNCDYEAITLMKKEAETVPPLTGEDMTEVIITQKA